jgi:digeranylgeranylglycerophospholipid reductase
MALQCYFKMKTYDVVIVGAGFAGLSVASHLSDSGLKVAVLEKNKEVHDYSSHYKATYMNTVKKFGIEGSVVKRYKKTYFHSKSRKAAVNLSQENAALIDTKKALDILKSKSKAAVIYNSEIIGAKRTKGEIELTDFKGRKFAGKMVIDASGRSFALSKLVSNRLPKAIFKFYGFDIENVALDDNEAGFFLDTRFGKAGMWIYPYSKSRCQIVGCEIEPLTETTKEHMRENLLRAIKGHKLYNLKNAKIIPKTELFYEIPIEPMEKMYAGRLLLVGDSAGQAAPLMGEGIRPALEMGAEAAAVVKMAFVRKDLSENFLKKYNNVWWQRFGRHYFWCILLRHFVILRFKDDDWDSILSKFSRLAISDKYKFIKSELTPEIISRLVSYKTFTDVIKGMIGGKFEDISVINPKKFLSKFV